MRGRTIGRGDRAWGRTLAAAGILGAAATAAWALAGDYDGTFGSGGIATTSVDMDSQVRGVAVQSDGRVLLAGFDRDVGSPGYSRWRIRRYGTGGALDTTFGTGGSATLFSAADAPVLFGMALDGDDILAAGQTTVLVKGKSVLQGTVARFDADGALDTSFGSSGIARLTALNAIGPVAIQPDGKVLVAGYKKVSTKGTQNMAWVIARLTAAGALDGTFGSGGSVVWNATGQDDSVNGMVLLPDGDIIVAGYTGGHNPGNPWVLARFSSSGTRETTLTRPGALLHRVAVDANGRVLAAGHSTTAVPTPTVVARYVSGPSGLALDASFGAGGESSFSLPGVSRFTPLGGIAFDGSGRIHLAGHDFNAAGAWLARLTPAGALDSTFGTGGAVGPIDPLATSLSRGVAIDGLGLIVWGGHAQSGTTTDPDLWWAARLLGE